MAINTTNITSPYLTLMPMNNTTNGTNLPSTLMPAIVNSTANITSSSPTLFPIIMNSTANVTSQSSAIMPTNITTPQTITNNATNTTSPFPYPYPFQPSVQTGMSSSSPQSTEFLAIVIPLMILLSILILVGNVMVIYIYFTHRHLRVPKNFFILSLAIADILIGTISVNFYTVFLSYNSWPFGEIACDMWLAMDYSSCNASTMTLMAISIERYMSVRHTAFHRNNLTRKRLKRIIIGLWVLSFAVWFPAVFVYPVFVGRRTLEDGQCHIQFIYESPSVTIITAFINFYGPIFIMLIIYFLISWTLVERYKRKYSFKSGNTDGTKLSSIRPESSSTSCVSEKVPEEQQPERKSTIATIVTLSEFDGEENEKKSYIFHNKAESTTLVEPNEAPKINSRKENKRKITPTTTTATTPKSRRQKDYLTHKRAVTLLFLIIGAFIITWLPYNLMVIIAPFCKSCIKEGWWHFGYIFCYVNSLLNPVCYAFGNRHFKQYFKEIFESWKAKLCCCCKKRSVARNI